MNRRHNSFGHYMKKTFGTTVYKVNVDAGFTCPNRDGTLGVTGCIYCNNDSFRPSSCKPALSVSEQIKNGIAYLSKRYRAEKFLAYFQPFSNTYAPAEKLETLYREALEEPAIIGLAIGTRPDCIDKEKLALLESLTEKHFILVEYGLQSIYEKTLRFIERGHDYKTFLDAVLMTRDKGIYTGAHLIAGFPTETREEMLSMADEISSVRPDFLKLHQLQVIKDTPLAEIYRENPFQIFGYDEYLDFAVDFIERLSPDIVLQRLFATAPDEILIAPRWDKSRHEITRDIEKRLAERDTFQGKKCRALHNIGRV
ncbi:MAG: TIGR01212 family radical SAM protein [Nitrospirae bacterium]|nr:MAG: TIGR01212 family radical SAM protein [Nitrospirota bacterium]